MRYEFNGPAAGAEFTWIVELAAGPKSFQRHDTITADEFAGSSGETKRNIEGLVARGILTVVEDGAVAADVPPAEDKTDDVPAIAPGKE
jgi:hypothetical protein